MTSVLSGWLLSVNWDRETGLVWFGWAARSPRHGVWGGVETSFTLSGTRSYGKNPQLSPLLEFIPRGNWSLKLGVSVLGHSGA